MAGFFFKKGLNFDLKTISFNLQNLLKIVLAEIIITITILILHYFFYKFFCLIINIMLSNILKHLLFLFLNL